MRAELYSTTGTTFGQSTGRDWLLDTETAGGFLSGFGSKEEGGSSDC